MRIDFYPKLAWEGIRKNKRLYFPYILTGCMMVMMYYILNFLENSPVLNHMDGGTVLIEVLPFGYWIIALFSVLFLFYSNSFLIKQRYREFGLYNMLGMDKKNICRIMVWETFFVSIIAIGVGLVVGVVASKAAELVLYNLLRMEVNFTLSIGVGALGQTTAVYAFVYGLLLCNSLIRVGRSKPIELVMSSKVGERVPKRAWVLGPVGVLLLAFAYYLAVSIEEPLEAFVWFFVAVILVIVGTYLLFIAGSVVFLKLLQKNKKYYYKANHFVSVSSMVYRMKRNGAGLASICVLLTMVLVMITSSACLYFGNEDALMARCPNNVNVTADFFEFDGISDETLDQFRNMMRGYSGNDADLNGVRACKVQGFIGDDGVMVDYDSNTQVSVANVRDGYLSVLSLADYNNMMDTEEVLSDDECLVYCSRYNYRANTFTLQYGNTYKVKEHLEEFQVDGAMLAMTAPVIYVVVNDLEDFAVPFLDRTGQMNADGDIIMTYNWRCGFDLDEPSQEKKVVAELEKDFQQTFENDEEQISMYSHDVFSREQRRESFYDMYGSLFFLGIMLSIVFLIAAVLIIYYKQISEGYEDYARFDIMKKVGMTKRDIRSSINSQMLTVFFLPLGFAGLHLGFAFPFVSKILLVFAFSNTALSIVVNVGCFVAFGIFYAVVYKMTSGTYYGIVSGKRE